MTPTANQWTPSKGRGRDAPRIVIRVTAAEHAQITAAAAAQVPPVSLAAYVRARLGLTDIEHAPLGVRGHRQASRPRGT